jgi:hypothetical protein
MFRRTVQDMLKQNVSLKKLGCEVLEIFILKIHKNLLRLKPELLRDSPATNHLNRGTA